MSDNNTGTYSHYLNNLEDWIEYHIDLIQDNKWEEIYNKLDDYASKHCYLMVGEFTCKMFEAGINPLDYLTYVPNGFLYGSSKYLKNDKKRDTFKIVLPKRITKIYENAFIDSCINEIIIHDKVDEIQYPFYNPGMIINYQSNKENWNKINFSTDWEDYGTANPLKFPIDDKVILICDGKIVNKKKSKRKNQFLENTSIDFTNTILIKNSINDIISNTDLDKEQLLDLKETINNMLTNIENNKDETV